MKLSMEKGKKYLVTYKTPQQRKNHTFVGTFLFIDERMSGDAIFSLRPVHGDTRMKPEYILKVELVDPSTPCGQDGKPFRW